MNVLLVDDHELLRQGLEMLLVNQASITTVLHAATAAEALQQHSDCPDLDLVILDYTLGNDRGIDVLMELKRRDPSLPIAVISAREDSAVILSALGAGASAFIPKTLSTDDTLKAINMVLDGNIYAPWPEDPNESPRAASDRDIARQQQLQRLTQFARGIFNADQLQNQEQASVETHMGNAFNTWVGEIQKDRSRLEALAFQDDLTGIANRRLFLERLDQALRNCRRNKTQMALVFLDLDRFKQLNDSLGHYAGDLLLKEIAQRLMRAVREVDTAARMGGDEFTLILVDVQSVDGLVNQLTRLRASLKSPLEIQGQLVRPSASIGAAISDGSESATELMARADESLYAVKAQGRDNFAIAAPPMIIDAQLNK
jgi:diguanylate cyclase (GGDEF)-like protein